MNMHICMGRLVAEPVKRPGEDGKPFITFRFAVDRTFRHNGADATDFFECVAFGKTAENLEKLDVRKGEKLVLVSELRNNNYTDRNGVARHEQQLVVNRFELCEKKGKAQPDRQPPEDDRPMYFGDVPF